MALDNVCMWIDGRGWTRITLDKVLDAYACLGTVSAKSQLFMCDACGQFVLLANGEQRQYFKHSAQEADKDCPDRSQSYSDWTKSTRSPPHDLPLRIRVTAADFYFELGLICLPSDVFEAVSGNRLTITPFGRSARTFSLADELLDDDITWLNVGNIPAKSYALSLTPECSATEFYWSRSTRGVDASGTVFDADNGRKLPPDSNVQLNRQYYLLTTKELGEVPTHVQCKLQCAKRHGLKTWRLYSIMATALTGDAAKFFLTYHCRLTDTPIEIHPLWSIHTKIGKTEPYIIRHDARTMYFCISGNANAGAFPRAVMKTIADKLFRIDCNSRQQIIASGRAQPLKYLYLLRGFPTFEIKTPVVTVTDIAGVRIADGVSNALPKSRRLQVRGEFDGCIEIDRNGVVENRIALHADVPIEIDSLAFGMEVRILQGLDCVWRLRYERAAVGIAASDEDLYARLRRGRGRLIAVPHSWISMLDRPEEYPRVAGWLHRSVRAGFVAEESYALFRRFVLNEGSV